MKACDSLAACGETLPSWRGCRDGPLSFEAAIVLDPLHRLPRRSSDWSPDPVAGLLRVCLVSAPPAWPLSLLLSDRRRVRGQKSSF
jgi:hypothetical protein